MNFESQIKRDENGDVVRTTSRHPSRCGATVAPGQDARWRGIRLPAKKLVSINTVDRLLLQQRAR